MHAIVFLLVFIAGCHAQLGVDYYRNTCPNVESIVRRAVEVKFQQTDVTVPATLRLFFHDCFVRVRTVITHSLSLIFPLHAPLLILY